jgi:hypothetical protein
VRVSGGFFVVLVDEAAEPVATVDLTHRFSLATLVVFGRPELEGTMPWGT